MYLSISMTHSKANNEIDYYPGYAMRDILEKDLRSKPNETNYSPSIKETETISLPI